MAGGIGLVRNRALNQTTFHSGTYTYDTRGNARTVTPNTPPEVSASATRNEDLLPGFQVLSDTGQVIDTQSVSGDQNRLLADAKSVFSYDADGRLLSRLPRAETASGASNPTPGVRNETLQSDSSGRVRLIDRDLTGLFGFSFRVA